MNRRARRAARITTALVAVGILLAPSQALADSIEPEPVDWPKVKPASGQVVEPQPVDWPTPTKT
ncbi:hypothetical protein EV649_5426 [Kribbella sp. VKM Ac-2569]|uniref:hypothetical protein n=1 Tax=Kribbella sp. VKM Ac-2569 TaxID=2512220 RepID=UPI00102BD856|nr:hypothetical protein [Kribbella sp. VKM Ac-2569]RZT14651.1 hypothetical protein EV649_5426 [Kribbella sp. VKM Ac-2569]